METMYIKQTDGIQNTITSYSSVHLRLNHRLFILLKQRTMLK